MATLGTRETFFSSSRYIRFHKSLSILLKKLISNLGVEAPYVGLLMTSKNYMENDSENHMYMYIVRITTKILNISLSLMVALKAGDAQSCFAFCAFSAYDGSARVSAPLSRD